MCGIAGIVAGPSLDLKRAIEQMVSAQRHRGPDDSGNLVHHIGDVAVALGHTRLSIIDLSEAGHQPMVHSETGDTLVYNGEIYNFKELRRELEGKGCVFRGQSDTEVLLHGLVSEGSSFIQRLEGMFAFGFFCRAKGEVLLARDPLGIKPLYMARKGQQLLFASEVRAILASGLVDRVIHQRALASYLAYGAVQGPDTIFRDIVLLDPGTYVTARCSDLQLKTGNHWRYPSVEPGLSESDVTDAYKEALDRSVRSHLVSDVPVGVFLSSGFDSTAIASLAARHASDVRTFTVAMAEQEELDESPLAEETARRLGAQHKSICVTMADAERLAHQWFGDMDQPTMDGLNTYVISKTVKEHGVTVALSGQGGDELLCGYPAFRDVPNAMRIRKLVDWLPSRMKAALPSLLAPGQTVAFKEKARDLLTCDPALASLYLRFRRMMSDRQMDALGLRAESLGLGDGFMDPGQLEVLNLCVTDPAAAISVLESKFYMGNMLLRDGDVFGMAHSLEIRVPMLDRKILDLLYTVPGKIRMPRGRTGKHLLQTAFPDFFRPEIANQKKRGFLLPIAAWMTGALKDACVSGLNVLKESGCVDGKGVDEIWNVFERDPLRTNWARTWTLCMLGIYLDRLKRDRAEGATSA